MTYNYDMKITSFGFKTIPLFSLTHQQSHPEHNNLEHIYDGNITKLSTERMNRHQITITGIV